MKSVFYYASVIHNGKYLLVIVTFICLSFSCATVKLQDVVDRSIPQVKADVPANISEIREIKHNSLTQEGGHKDLHFSGVLFTKSIVNGSTQIGPCGNCIVTLRGNDSLTVANLTTAPDGFFNYHGKHKDYSLVLENAGHNKLYIDRLQFETEGVTTIKIINAAGTESERFAVTKTGKNYTWTKVQ